MNLKLIADWKKSYRLYSMQIGLVILGLSVIDGVLRELQVSAVPYWAYSISAVVLLIARLVVQFLGSSDADGS